MRLDLPLLSRLHVVFDILDNSFFLPSHPLILVRKIQQKISMAQILNKILIVYTVLIACLGANNVSSAVRR
jgi:hypothetical protein